MYLPAVNVYVLPQHKAKYRQLAGLLRGLANSYDGFTAISGLGNHCFSSGRKVRFGFSSVGKAHEFQAVAETVMGPYIKIRRLVV